MNSTKRIPGSLSGAALGARVSLSGYAAIFAAAFLLLFLGMSRWPNIYDESLVLTAAMRVAAGQVPHRDFYANYGPAEFYALAGLFKLFGPSVLVERLFDVFIKSVMVAMFFGLTSRYCSRWPTCAATLALVLWLFGNPLAGTPVVPVGLLNLAGCLLILPIFSQEISAGRLFAAGVVSGMATLFRYDAGIALFALQAMAITIAILVRPVAVATRIRLFLNHMVFAAAGYVVVTVPVAIAYLRVAPLRDFVYDILQYPSQYYHRGRNLPFPRIHLRTLDDLICYVPIAVFGLTLIAIFYKPGQVDAAPEFEQGVPGVRGLLLLFGVLGLLMYVKGLVRISTFHMYLCIPPTLFLLAVAYERRRRLPKAARGLLAVTVTAVVLATLSVTVHSLKTLRGQCALVLERPSRQLPQPLNTSWCSVPAPMTRGLCFLSELDRLDTAQFLQTHTHPGDTLFVGVSNHQRIVANDNMLYFATQRLPATKWSHFDPGLQNSLPIQQQMISELKTNRPPYIVLDDEFASFNEPNDSSRYSGVTLLDDYLRSRYQEAQTFGRFSVWKRKASD